MRPVITVMLSVYNCQRFIAEAVQSILDQTYQDFEFFITDDGSTDRTSEILGTFHDQRIRRFCNKKNEGLIRSLNRMANEAHGTYLARMDADDITHPFRFEKQIIFLNKNPEIGVVGTNAVQIDRRRHPISILVMPETHALIVWRFFFGLAIVHPTVMMRRDVFLSSGGYCENFLYVEDMELWSRLLPQTRFANLQETLHQRRLHDRSIGSTKSAAQISSNKIIRRGVFERTLGVTVSDDVLEWFDDPFHILSHEQKKELVCIYKSLFEYVKKVFPLTADMETYMAADLAIRVRQAEMGDCHHVQKMFARVVRASIPMTMRHRLKMSRLGKYISKRI